MLDVMLLLLKITSLQNGPKQRRTPAANGSHWRTSGGESGGESGSESESGNESSRELENESLNKYNFRFIK